MSMEYKTPEGFLLSSKKGMGCISHEFKPILSKERFVCKHGLNGKAHLGCYEKWLKEFQAKPIGFLDIEANGLKADFNFMYSWALKIYDGIVYNATLTQADINLGRYDLNLLKSLIPRLKQCSVIITYYGSRFDIPFIRTRTLYHGLEFVRYGEVLHLDLYDYVKKYLNLHSKKLHNVVRILHIYGKYAVNPEIWLKALHDENARKEIEKHNIQDVIALEKVYKVLKPYIRGVSRSI